MADSTLTLNADVALSLHGASATYVPQTGSGPVACLALMRPLRDEVAEFPALRDVRGAERPSWAVSFRQSDLPGRPKPGDRVTFAMGVTMQLREVRSDPHTLWWITSAFVVEDTTTDLLGLSIYMPRGAGFSTAGSLLS